jgi:DHA1 family bicyclomycin/chloramphenicol resistance-like MFS transporter
MAGRRTESALLTLGMALSLVGIAAIAALAATDSLSLATISVALYLYAAGQGLVFPTTATAAIRPFPTRAGTASSAYLFAFMLMAALGSISPALVHPEISIGLPAAMAILMALSLPCLIVVHRPAERAAQAKPPA